MKHKQIPILFMLLTCVLTVVLSLRTVPPVSATTTTVYITTGGNDGHVWGHSSSYGTAHNTATGADPSGQDMDFGQMDDGGNNYFVYRAFLKFDTSSIPAGATITSAVLWIYGEASGADEDFTIRLQKWTGDTPISTSSYNQFDGINYDDGLADAQSSWGHGFDSVTVSNFSLITKGGNTLICVRSSRDISSIPPDQDWDEYWECYCYDTPSSPSFAPYLIVTYTSAVSITVTSSPTGSGYVTVDGSAITTPQTYSWTPGDSHTIAANSPANLVSGQSQYTWQNWNDSGTQSHSITVPASATCYNATFQLQYYLTVQGGDSPSGLGWYNNGVTKTITNYWVWNSIAGQSRTALTNYYLDTSAQNPARSNSGNFTTPTITMSTYHNVTFSNITQYYLTVTGGNSISYGTASPTGDNWYDSGGATTVSSDWVWNTITSQSRTAITNYAIDGTGQNPARQGTGTLTTISVSMTSYHIILFSSITQYYVTLLTGTSGTTVGQSGSQTSDNWYDSGSSASISATTPFLNGTTNRFIFLNWQWYRGGVLQTNSSSSTFVITMSNYVSATAYWSEDLINLYSYSIAAPRVNVASSPYINLTYRWWSDNVPVASGFTVKVNGVSRTITSGWTNFTDTSATVQTITYQLTQAEGGAYYVNSVVPSETWERVKIVSGAISGSYAHVNGNVLVDYVLEYESDSSLVTDGNVFLNGTGMTYNASSARWELNVTSTIIASNHYQVSAVSGNLYGITVINDAVGPVGPCQWYANLNLQTVDVDSDPLTQAVVYMNNGSGGTIPSSGPPGTGYAIVGYTGWWTQTVSAGGWANYTGMTNGTIQIYVSWYGLTVNQTFTLTYNTDTTLNVACLAYPYTVSSVMFWTASNATITAASWSSNLLTVSFSAPLNTYTLIANCPIIPRYILNESYNIATCYSSYLQLLHYANATLTISYESWGDLYIQSTDQTLVSASIVSGQLEILPSGTNGMVSTLQVYCGALGNPASTSGFTAGTYGSQIYTGNYVLNGQTLTLSWATSPFSGGGTGTGTTGPTITVNIALFFPSQATQGQTVNGTLTVTWQSYAMIFVWQALCLQPYSGWVVNLGALPLTLQTAKTTGNVSLPIMLTVPAGTVDGSYQIPCSVTFQTPTGVSKTVGSTIALTIGPAPAPVTAASVPFILMGSFVGLFALFIGTLFMRRNRSRKQQF